MHSVSNSSVLHQQLQIAQAKIVALQREIGNLANNNYIPEEHDDNQHDDDQDDDHEHDHTDAHNRQHHMSEDVDASRTMMVTTATTISTNNSPTHINGRKSPAAILRDDDISSEVAAATDELLTRIRDPNELLQVRLECMNSIAKLIKNVHQGAISTPVPVIAILKSLRIALVDTSKDVRSHVFRVLRHISLDSDMVQSMLDIHLDLFIVRTLTRDQRYDAEREQALKLIRGWIDAPGGAAILPQSLVRMMVALAEQTDEKFRTVCAETLSELAIRNPELLALSGGFKVLIQVLLEGPPELTMALTSAVIHILDSQVTRKYLRPAVELEAVISHFTDVYSKGPAHDERLNSCSRVVIFLLRGWTGLLYMCMDDKRAIRTIVEALRLPTDETRRILLEMYFVIFQVGHPRKSSESPKTGIPGTDDILSRLGPSPRFHGRTNLIDQFVAVLLLVFIDAGLLEALVELAQCGSNKIVVSKATQLIGELIDLGNRLLPLQFGAKIQSLPSLFKLASNFQDPSQRHTAAVALAHIDNIHMTKDKLISSVLNSESANQITEGHLVYGRVISNRNEKVQRQVDHVKIRIGMQIDDMHFKNLLADTQLSANEQGLTKDYTKWNWDAILELLQGPLLNPKRLDEATKNTKFIKRLLAFYRPQNHQFSDIRKNKANTKYVRIGCELLKTLVASPEGVRILSENKLLEQIAECLAQLDPIQHAAMPGEHMFSKERMEKYLTGDYFTMLATLSKSQDGVRLMERFKLYTIYYHLTELRSRDDLIRTIIESMDYNFDGHPRVILSKVMTSAYKHIRLFATNHLRSLLRSGVVDFSVWGVPLLVTQLYDPTPEVCERAVAVLEEACNDRQNLEAAVRLRPSLDSLGIVARDLFLSLLSIPSGFAYLKEVGYVDREMDYWYQEGNELYVTLLEVSLPLAVFDTWKSPAPSTDTSPARMVNPPDLELEEMEGLATARPHFYGELAKTKEGCALLQEKRHYKEFAGFIRKHGFATYLVPADLVTLKAMLWAMGKIGSSKLGLAFLIEEDIIKVIVEMAEKCSILSLRGTAFYIIALLARTPEAVEILEKYGWEAVSPPTTNILNGLCVPRDISKYLVIPHWYYIASWPRHMLRVQKVLEMGNFDSVEEEVLKSIGNMSNHILANNASKSLSKLRHDQSSYFSKVELYMQVMRMLSCYHYRLTARKFLQEVFERISFTPSTLEVLDSLAPLSPSLSQVSNSADGVAAPTDDFSGEQDGWDDAIYSANANMSPNNNSGSGVANNDGTGAAAVAVVGGADQGGQKQQGGGGGKANDRPLPAESNSKDKNDTRQSLVPQMTIRGFVVA
ncbi:hypothetical protein SmJEL517_g03313 [Synchytrium microbalum]|uniref:Uncharacterized protein n=1 Tax=Synchytrium microbalum TaxID=1806994 RepID=A0A507BX31_9FUNG|nr:uncharacterized protein SmJEL517_g03313 [Synchytrium microbalum]TPX33890.1 hypothetical protein SmJEL517_g03313 [Synchytrium microbalum]